MGKWKAPRKLRMRRVGWGICWQSPGWGTRTISSLSAVPALAWMSTVNRCGTGRNGDSETKAVPNGSMCRRWKKSETEGIMSQPGHHPHSLQTLFKERTLSMKKNTVFCFCASCLWISTASYWNNSSLLLICTWMYNGVWYLIGEQPTRQ